MVYRFKYKLIKNILHQYFDLKELNLNVANENTVINISTDDNIFFSLYVNEHEDDFKFNADENLVSYLVLIEHMFDIAKVTEYLLDNEEISIRDNDTILHITKLKAFGFPVLLIGDEDYLLATPLSDNFDNDNIEDIVIALLGYYEARTFPEINFKIILDKEIFARFPDSLKELDCLEIEK